MSWTKWFLPLAMMACVGDAAEKEPVDADGDGYELSEDCNDADAAVNPDADELCNGVDDNCDGAIDEDAVDGLAYFPDADGDGYGELQGEFKACEQPEDTSLNADDCDDADATINPEATEMCGGVDEDCDGLLDGEDDNVQGTETFYEDLDGDGYGVADLWVEACEAPANHVEIAGDCDDANTAIAPGQPEICDGVDSDCDGQEDSDDVDATDRQTFYIDGDGDGYGRTAQEVQACELPDGAAIADGDCNDGDDNVHPGMAELCNGIDDDCDALIDGADPEVTGLLTFFVDADADGYGTDVEVEACSLEVGMAEVSGDCNDADLAVYPGAVETCNGIDDDCNDLADTLDPGTIDRDRYYGDFDNDGFGTPNFFEDACEPVANHVLNSDDCDDGDVNSFPGGIEVCGGGDEDCDGLTNDDDPDVTVGTWYDDEDEDGFGASGTGVDTCDPPVGAVTNGDDCDDAEPLAYPGASEECDGIDNDCDGLDDETDPDTVGFATFYDDTDGDGYGDPNASVGACVAPPNTTADNTDCDDTDGATYPGADEYCDGEDRDCDGTPDNDALDFVSYYPDADSDGYGDENAVASLACLIPPGSTADNTDCDDNDGNSNPDGVEVCNGGADDDCDGLVDDQDPDALLGDWYLDGDGDGYGDGPSTLACDAPLGHVPDDGDCDDADEYVNPGAVEICNLIDDNCVDGIDDADPAVVGATDYYTDGDGDGYGTGPAVVACVQPPYTVLLDGDCDDGDGTVSPGELEVCGGGDEDCNGLIDEQDPNLDDGFNVYVDGDLDGEGDENALAETACAVVAGYSATNFDCDDTNPDAAPGLAEVCDGFDNDCNDDVDAADLGLTDGVSGYPDLDGDGYGDELAASTPICPGDPGYVEDNTDCADDNAYVNMEPRFDFADAYDQDCDGSFDEDVGTETYTHDIDIQPIWDNKCDTCHVPGGSGGMTLTNGYTATVLVPSNDVPSMFRIEPGRTDLSYIWHKISGTQVSVGGNGGTMPLSGSLTQLERDMIETWILEGAVQ